MCPVHDGSGTCYDRTTDEARRREGHTLVDDDSLRFPHDGEVGEHPRVGELVGIRAANPERLPQASHRVSAVRRLTAVASIALPTVAEGGEDDVIADLHFRRGAADLLDDAGSFVPEHDRRRERDRPVENGHIGVAEAGAMHAHAYLVRLDLAQLDVVTNLELARPYDRLHGPSPPQPMAIGLTGLPVAPTTGSAPTTRSDS